MENRDTALTAPTSDDGGPPYVDNRPFKASANPKIFEYKATFIIGD